MTLNEILIRKYLTQKILKYETQIKEEQHSTKNI